MNKQIYLVVTASELNALARGNHSSPRTALAEARQTAMDRNQRTYVARVTHIVVPTTREEELT